jgi:hypothetical protein
MSVKFIEISQDAACILENKNEDCSGVFTAGIQSCLIYIFKTTEADILIHDSGQLHIKGIYNLVKKYGELKKLTVVYGAGLNSTNQSRYPKLVKMLEIAPDNIDVKSSDYGAFSLCFDRENGINLYPDNSVPAGVTPLPEKTKVETIIEINNFFLPVNAQSLPVDIQYRNSSFTNSTKLKFPIKKLLKTVQEQPKYFFQNIAFLKKGYDHKLYVLPPAILNLANKYKVSKFMFSALTPLDEEQQTQSFNEFVNK